nr:C25 family cysteine peptidase [uncultured Pedobacter sp.]
MKQITLLILFLLVTSTGFAQTIYGNEWIKSDQPYAKVKISENGVYRITYSQLQILGFFNNGNATKGFQLFYLGQEVPIKIEGDGDNSFDSNDYIIFYAKPNNGKIETDLYKPGEQPNPEVSLFDDVATYFITNSSTEQGKRYQNVNLSPVGITPETNIIYTSSKNLATQYYPGQYVLDVMTFSDYIEGEGYLGNTFSIGSVQNQSLNTPNFYIGSTFKPFFQSYVAGRSNASSTDPSGNNHHLNISVDGITVKDVTYRGYKTVRIAENLTNTTLNSTTNISFSSIDNLGAITDFQATGYVRITYPRTLDATNYNFLEFNLNSANNNCLLNFSNSNTWTKSAILNPNLAEFYPSTKNGSINSFVVKNTNEPLIVYNESALKNTSLETVSFNLVNPALSNAKMLIITHQSLLNGVNDIVNYKNSKGVSSSAITTEELYNQFGYGIHSALALRNYCKFLVDKSTVKPDYLFLVGKGYELSKEHLTDEMVPTYGFPPSDISITSHLEDNNVAPTLATGRISVKSLEEVENYLNKIKSYDNQPNEMWRKNLINITGGGNTSEDTQFSSYLKGLSATAGNPLFGGKTTSFYKNTADPITDNLVGKINTGIEKGASLLTYLGHGSTIGTAVSIGNPNDINNKDKLLFYYINGCSTGNAFTTKSLGEDYISQKDKGAIAWLGTSSEGVASYLAGIADLFYKNSFNLNYGKSVAQNLATSIRTYQNPNDALNKIHCQQFIYLGDPSLSFYSPDKPDYEIKPEDISLTNQNVTANSPNFDLQIIVRNNGKAISSPLKINIKRTLADKSVITYPSQIFNPVLNTDTIIFNIDNNLGVNSSGSNSFLISLDPNGEQDELNEGNNTATFNNFFPSNGITLISPSNFAIVNNANVELKLEANNLFSKDASYTFEIDTVSTFNSSWKKTSGIINSGLFASWQPGNIYTNNAVYYWRAKLNVPLQDGGQWQTGSFTFIPTSGDGFNQGHYQQFSNINLKNIVLKNNTFEYTKTSYPIYVQTRGNTAPTNTERRIRVNITVGALSFNGSEFSGFSIASFDPKNSRKLYNYASAYNSSNDGGVSTTGQFFFDTNNSVALDSLSNYLAHIPNGYYVVGLSGVNFSGKDLPNNIKNQLRDLGLTKFENVGNGEPYIFSTEKGNLSSSLLKEVTADYSSTSPAQSQYITFNEDLPNNWNSGFYESEKIGPSTKWATASFNFKSDLNDNIVNSVIGIDKNGLENILKDNLSSNFVDISDINANTYPYLRLKSTVTDNKDNTAAELKSWKVLFDGCPDLSFNPELSNSFYAKEINEGDSLKLESAVSNLINLPTDSVLVKYTITKANRTTEKGLVKTLNPFKNIESQNFKFSFPTTSLVGENILQLTLVPKNGIDLLTFNDVISYPFKVIGDQKNPIVDLLFDGKHIINGELVSPRPSITISLNDENKFLLLNDTNSVAVFIKKGDEEYHKVSFSSNKLSIQKTASAEDNTISYQYQPDQLSDGVYTLKIQAKDKSGNTLTNDYLTDFEVVNAQTISNVLPYPNPVVNSTRFVFQVTGSVPDKMRIQISTASGKIVRVINKTELGNIRIGNNISDFSWDGTDSFGDRLANGVYFYQVFVENNNGSSVNKKNNSANTYFKNNIGKIYLMK